MKCYIAINYIIAKLENEYKMQYYDIKIIIITMTIIIIVIIITMIIVIIET